jgi:cullin-associated NEDD8-dissociated protein 1
MIDRDEVSRRLDTIAERFQSIILTKLKENAIKQEVEKLKEVVKEVITLTARLRHEFSEATNTTATSGQAFRSYVELVKKDYAAQLQAAEIELRQL